MRTRIIHIPVKQWFPPNDPIAILVLKLCILREDYLLELAGMIHGEWFNLKSKPTYKGYQVGLDDNSDGWRRAYFFRNSLKTLFEIKEEVEAFFGEKGKNKGLKAALAQESRRFRDVIKLLRNKMQIAEKTVAHIRHNLGGHVSRGEIQKILRDMPDDTKALFQDAELTGKKRYRFVGDIVLRMFLPGVPEDEQSDKLEGLVKETAQLIPVFQTIDAVFSIYVQDRKLSH